MDERLASKCPIITEIDPKAAEIVEGLLGPEVCVRYCYYSAFGPDPEKAIEVEQGIFFENRREDLGIYRVFVAHGKEWILFEEEPC